MGDAAAPRGLEVDADAAIGERLDGVVCEGRAKEVAAEAFELLAIAAIDGRRGVEVHAEGRHRQRRRGDGLGCGREVRAGERALHAGAKRRVHVEVVVRVRGEERVMHLREHGGHTRWRRRVCMQEANALAEVLEDAVRDQAVQVDVETEVAAESLHRDHDAGVQRRD
ncbi:hypothetical protein SAMN02745121_08791 [Nannocystis exedens]|uniref:Uncharacterized protein n=1 Tax=Nannocystis exedens TaxID=54 RepID=A0A1I2INM8_9BACT|nr:hypothetical protein NAEX_05594 [Nannocystis exedens]SFF42657.1 hypothetical protein SAMN02745121_08791 [Nannocystis exedens]